MIIKNKKEIATTDSRRRVLKILESGIEKVLPDNLISSFVKYDSENKILSVKEKTYNVSDRRIFVIGGGKAAGLMAEALEDILGADSVTAGILNCDSDNYNTKKIKIIKAGHPIPNKEGVVGVKKMLSLKKEYTINENDLVICLISGGGSALMNYPVDDISLEDQKRTTDVLISCGAEISEINIVRKSLSKIKGGKLAQFYKPAKIISLIISDVIGDKLDTIASGPTVANTSNFSDSLMVLEKYNLASKVPESVINFLNRESNKQEQSLQLDNVDNYIIGNNRLALEEMKIKAEELGFFPLIITEKQEGEPGEVAKQRALEIKEGKYDKYNLLIIGGECCPVLPNNHGKGGRNQHYVAVSMLEMKDCSKEWVVSSVSSDGRDFSLGVAGGIIDNNSFKVAKEKGIDVEKYINNYDSNTLLKEIGSSLVETGHTGTNVSDFIIYFIDKS